jgi:hypothetical protein
MRVFRVLMLASSLLAVGAAQAKDKNSKPPQQDAIEVVGHIPLTGGVVTGFVPTPHYSSYYLYVEHEGGKNVTLVDVTKVTHPVVLADASYPVTSASLFVVAGTAALITEQQIPTVAAPTAQTVRIMDFSDPQHPKVAREFSGVTTMTRDDRRGLIFVANPEGIWILHQSFATDPEVEKAYAHHVLYDH